MRKELSKWQRHSIKCLHGLIHIATWGFVMLIIHRLLTEMKCIVRMKNTTQNPKDWYAKQNFVVALTCKNSLWQFKKSKQLNFSDMNFPCEQETVVIITMTYQNVWLETPLQKSSIMRNVIKLCRITWMSENYAKQRKKRPTKC